jgi:hypothetical protein
MTVVLLGGSAIALTTAMPAINTQPVASSTTAGASTTFTVAATGCPAPTYQWQRQAVGSTWQNLSESTTYTGVQTGTLTIAATTTAMSGDQFRVQISNSSGSATSNVAALTVTGSAMPPPPSTPTTGGGGTLDKWLLLALTVLVLRATGISGSLRHGMLKLRRWP